MSRTRPNTTKPCSRRLAGSASRGGTATGPLTAYILPDTDCGRRPTSATMRAAATTTRLNMMRPIYGLLVGALAGGGLAVMGSTKQRLRRPLGKARAMAKKERKRWARAATEATREARLESSAERHHVPIKPFERGRVSTSSSPGSNESKPPGSSVIIGQGRSSLMRGISARCHGPARVKPTRAQTVRRSAPKRPNAPRGHSPHRESLGAFASPPQPTRDQKTQRGRERRMRVTDVDRDIAKPHKLFSHPLRTMTSTATPSPTSPA